MTGSGTGTQRKEAGGDKAAAARDADAARILGAISDAEIVELEKTLVRVPSYTGEERELAEVIAAYLRENGIDARLQQVPLSHHFRHKTDRQASCNVIGHLPGTGSGGAASLIFNGHMDHGPWAIGERVEDRFETWKRKPWEPVVEGDVLYGKGAQDEKGGLTAMLAAAVALRRSGVRLSGDVFVCPVMGHKTHSLGTKVLLESGLSANYGINTENSGNWIVPVHPGILSAEIRVRGASPKARTRRIELAYQASAFQNAARLVARLGAEGTHQGPTGWLSYEPHPVLKYWPLYRVEYMRRLSLEEVAVGLLVTTVPGQDDGTVVRDLQRVAAALENEFSDFAAGEITADVWGPPLETPRSSPLVEAVAWCEAELSGTPANVGPEGRWGAYGCGALMGAAGIQTVIYGPGENALAPPLRRVVGDDTPDERIHVPELVRAARVMALAAYQLCR
jgi:acetylornithine deacetylase/succinyl-diaminopimelate desuccinylase-like protein